MGAMDAHTCTGLLKGEQGNGLWPFPGLDLKRLFCLQEETGFFFICKAAAKTGKRERKKCAEGMVEAAAKGTGEQDKRIVLLFL